MKPLAGISEAQAYDQSPPGEEKTSQGEGLGEDDRPSCHSDSGDTFERELEVSELILPTLRTKRQKKKGAKKAAASALHNFAAEHSPVLMNEAPASENASPTQVAHNLS